MNLEELNADEKKQLTEIEDGVKDCLINIKRNKYKIGKMLDKANAVLPYGFFQTWIKETFGDHLSYSTGYFYMRCYRTFKEDPEELDYLPTKYLHKMTENDFPEKVRRFLTDKIIEQGSLNGKWKHAGKWEDIISFYKMFKDDMFDEEGLLWCVKDIFKRDWYEKNRNGTVSVELFNKKERESLYKKSHKLLKKLDKLIKRSNGYAWIYPFNQDDDKLHDSVIDGIDDSIERLRELIRSLKRTKKSLTGGDGIFNPVSTATGTKFVLDDDLKYEQSYDPVDQENIDWDELDWENWDDAKEEQAA